MKSENNIVEGALKVHKLTFWEAAMIIVGANIGSGILGLAYSARKSGWPVLMLWLIIAGFFTTASMLYVAETTLRTRKVMQLPGLAKKYVGELGAWLVFISVAANTIGCLIAYTNGSGRILSEMFGLSTDRQFAFFCSGCHCSLVWPESDRRSRESYQLWNDGVAGGDHSSIFFS